MGFRPGNKSRGMAAYAAATAAAGEVMEGADRFIIPPAGASWFGNIAGRRGGYRSGQSGKFNLPWIHFLIEALFLVEYEVYLFTATVKAR